MDFIVWEATHFLYMIMLQRSMFKKGFFSKSNWWFKNIASIVDSNTEKVLASSLNTAQKKEYDAAIKAGKEVEFKPVVKNEVKESDKKALLTYADKMILKLWMHLILKLNC